MVNVLNRCIARRFVLCVHQLIKASKLCNLVVYPGVPSSQVFWTIFMWKISLKKRSWLCTSVLEDTQWHLCQDSFHAVKERVSTGLYHSELVTDKRISGNFFSLCSSFTEQEGILDIIEELDWDIFFADCHSSINIYPFDLSRPVILTMKY